MKKSEEEVLKLYDDLGIADLPGAAWELATYILGILANDNTLNLNDLSALLRAFKRDRHDVLVENNVAAVIGKDGGQLN